MNNGISPVIPACLAEENRRFLLPQIHHALKETGKIGEILIINICHSMNHAEGLCREQNALRIRCKDNGSYGNANRTGIRHAHKGGIMDGDGSLRPGVIPPMSGDMEKENLNPMIGSRYVKGGDSANGPLLKLPNAILNPVFRRTFHLSVKNLSGSFRKQGGHL